MPVILIVIGSLSGSVIPSIVIFFIMWLGGHNEDSLACAPTQLGGVLFGCSDITNTCLLVPPADDTYTLCVAGFTPIPIGLFSTVTEDKMLLVAPSKIDTLLVAELSTYTLFV